MYILKKNKWLFAPLFVLLCFFISFNSFATSSGGGVNLGNATSLSQQLCDLRQMFCGKTAYVVMMISIIIMGLLLFAGKLTWTFVLLVCTAGAIFVSAERVASLMISYPVDCQCGGIWWLFGR